MSNAYSQMNRFHKQKNGGNEMVKEKKLLTRIDLAMFGTWSYKALNSIYDQKKTVKVHLSPGKCPNSMEISFDLA